MRITKNQLKQIIKEELEAIIAQEGIFDFFRRGKKGAEKSKEDIDSEREHQLSYPPAPDSGIATPLDFYDGEPKFPPASVISSGDYDAWHQLELIHGRGSLQAWEAWEALVADREARRQKEIERNRPYLRARQKEREEKEALYAKILNHEPITFSELFPKKENKKK
jgi:hypothetical protein